MLNPDRFFPAEPTSRSIAAKLYETVRGLPLICPHGHTMPKWFSDNDRFQDPAQLLIVPDHYILRMLVSQGISLSSLGVASNDCVQHETDGRTIWRHFSANYHLFRSTPVRIWMDHTLSTLFDIQERPSAGNSDRVYDTISELLAAEAYRPRALFKRFNIEVLATTDGCNDDLSEHDKISSSEWNGRVIPTYRPDAVVDPDYEGFRVNIETLGELTGEDISS